MNARGTSRESVGGVILAGGASRRLSAPPKAFRELGGKPLIEHVIGRVQPQVQALVLSVAREDSSWERFGLQLVVDAVPHSVTKADGQDDTPGPLAGLLSGMEVLSDRHDWILAVPCDAPFLPLDLGQQLLDAVREQGTKACVAVYEGVLQSTFSLWHRSLLPELRNAVRVAGHGGFKQFLAKFDHSEQAWEPQPIPPFFNVNTADDLVQAEELLEQSLRELHAAKP